MLEQSDAKYLHKIIHSIQSSNINMSIFPNKENKTQPNIIDKKETDN